MFETTRRRFVEALGIGGAGTVLGSTATGRFGAEAAVAQSQSSLPSVDRVAGDPTDVPSPIDRDEPTEHDVTLRFEEVVAEVEPGVEFTYFTFDGQVPGPMLRVRRGDTVTLTVESPEVNVLPHNVDLHAVYGSGGGAVHTDAGPGEENAIRFQAAYPGAYIYHCAVHNLDYHISSGMFGMIVVEPEDGLPPVDRELYVSQHEIYTDRPVGEEGNHNFDFDAMLSEEPTYVVQNGEHQPFVEDRYGTIDAEQGETIRVFFVNGGPNLSSAIHPIGNVWERAWRDGAPGDPEEFVQTMNVPPGSCMMGTMETPIPERITLVDHALTRTMRRGMLGYVDVEGEPDPEIYDPDPFGEDDGEQGEAASAASHAFSAVGGAPQIAEAARRAMPEHTLRRGAVVEDESDVAGGAPTEVGTEEE